MGNMLGGAGSCRQEPFSLQKPKKQGGQVTNSHTTKSCDTALDHHSKCLFPPKTGPLSPIREEVSWN